MLKVALTDLTTQKLHINRWIYILILFGEAWRATLERITVHCYLLLLLLSCHCLHLATSQLLSFYFSLLFFKLKLIGHVYFHTECEYQAAKKQHLYFRSIFPNIYVANKCINQSQCRLDVTSASRNNNISNNGSTSKYCWSVGLVG